MSEDAGLSIYTYRDIHTYRTSWHARVKPERRKRGLLDEALDTANLAVRREEKRKADAWHFPTCCAAPSLVHRFLVFRCPLRREKFASITAKRAKCKHQPCNMFPECQGMLCARAHSQVAVAVAHHVGELRHAIHAQTIPDCTRQSPLVQISRARKIANAWQSRSL